MLTSVVPVAAGESHTLAPKQDGTVWGWGESVIDGQVGDGIRDDRQPPVQVMDAR
jgi:alpha-tubulin suppressor-like RCC1 family protein